MAALRPHLALAVTDVARAIPFYEALLGVAPEKRRPGYAKFSVADPALNLTLNEGPRAGGLGALDHAGIQVASTAEVLAARDRLAAAGLATFDERDTTCCYARQDKVWVHDPDGTPWEVFVTHEDTEEAGTGPDLASCCATTGKAGCCGEAVGAGSAPAACGCSG